MLKTIFWLSVIFLSICIVIVPTAVYTTPYLIEQKDHQPPAHDLELLKHWREKYPNKRAYYFENSNISNIDGKWYKIGHSFWQNFLFRSIAAAFIFITTYLIYKLIKYIFYRIKNSKLQKNI